MKLGMPELLLILIVATVLIFGVRFFGAPPAKRDDSPERYQFEREQERRYDERVKATRRSRIQILGAVAILAGIALFLYSATLFGLIEKAVWGPAGAVILVALGVFAIFSARRR